MKIHWIKLLGVTFSFSLILHLSIISGVLADLIGAEGFYAQYAFLGYLFYLYPLSMIGASLIVTVWVKHNKTQHFFITLLTAVAINVLLFSAMSMFARIQTADRIQHMYHDNPQRRPLLDPQRPLTIVDPLVVKQNTTSPIDIVVYALPGVLESGTSKAQIKKGPDLAYRLWGEGVLVSNGERTKEGRIIYRASIDFEPDKDWDSGLIIIRGNNGEVETSIIQK
ncbi:MAG: hypothetical protein CSA61_00830 [Neptuniibacter caesariensis]|uniref:Uncharacterized protein n=1 Tax=Neptuniibacter caesariensis TaxID=207954 RepID=A0A2G6JBE5_NEPCE|nr:MAG: hypothetical protein CSA61_00830 [Neptuniibacter caesariensis]